MFRAIRGWWSSDKALHLAGLFAFEFVVVVLGVLTAQAVANWSRDRAARSEMLVSKSLADVQIAHMAARVIGYRRTIPCMEQRVVQIMRAASGEGEVDPAMLERPLLPSFPFTNFTDEGRLQLRGQFGDDITGKYQRIAEYSDRTKDNLKQLADDWQTLAIINPDYGKVGTGDRQEARIVASRMLSTLRSLWQVNVNIGNRARELGIAPRLDAQLRLPDGCADLWRWNSVMYDPVDGLAQRDRHLPKD